MSRLVIVVLCIACLSCTATFSRTDPSRPAHHTDDGFRNLYLVESDKSFFSFLKMRFFSDVEWADHEAMASEVPVTQVDMDAVLQPSQQAQVTWLGHSSFLIQYKGMSVLTDPVFSDRASPYQFIGPKRYVPHVVDYTKLPKIDAVIISHNHYDHLDQQAIEQLAVGDTRFYVPLGISAFLKEQGVKQEFIIELDWWQSNASNNLNVQALPSQHWSARGLFDRFDTLWASWSIQIGQLHIWFAGDTGYNATQFKQIGANIEPIDVALIPIGAYAPRWFMQDFHVNPQEALQIHQDVGAGKSIGMHWGTFGLTAEPPLEPVQKLEAAKQDMQIGQNAFVTMSIGQTMQLD